MMTPRAERCDVCRFWARNLGQAGFGECRRHSPVIVATRTAANFADAQTGSWPSVRENDWCGEFLPLFDGPMPPPTGGFPPLP